MKSVLLGISSSILLMFGMGGLFSLIDSYCFPDLVNDNLGYGFLQLFRLVPLIGQSIATGIIVGLLTRNKGAAGLVGVVSGSVFTLILVIIAYHDFRLDLPHNSLVEAFRDTFFQWGEYIIWAVSLLLSGTILLAQKATVPKAKLLL